MNLHLTILVNNCKKIKADHHKTCAPRRKAQRIRCYSRSLPGVTPLCRCRACQASVPAVSL